MIVIQSNASCTAILRKMLEVNISNKYILKLFFVSFALTPSYKNACIYLIKHNDEVAKLIAVLVLQTFFINYNITGIFKGSVTNSLPLWYWEVLKSYVILTIYHHDYEIFLVSMIRRIIYVSDRFSCAFIFSRCCFPVSFEGLLKGYLQNRNSICSDFFTDFFFLVSREQNLINRVYVLLLTSINPI